MARAVALIAFATLLVGASAMDAFRARTLDYSAAENTVMEEGGGVTLRGTATHYDWAGGGGNTCKDYSGVNDPMCVAPSDGWDELWTKVLKVTSKCTNEACKGSCKKCCEKPGPGCHYEQLCKANGGHLCVRCADNRAGVCKTRRWVRVAISDACPRYHPCNTCKGRENPCAQGLKNVDLCDKAYRTIANKQPDWKGVVVDVSTNLRNC